MVHLSRAKRYESAQDDDCTDYCIAAGHVAKAHKGVTARIAGHTFLPSLLGPDSVVLDIGANEGHFARAIVRDFDCKVHAVEPNPYLYTGLQELAISGVTAHGVALAGTRGPRPFQVMNNSEASHFPNVNGSNEGTIQVQAVTLEDLISQISAPAGIDLIKMDIEGAELDVLEHVPARVLERVRQLTIEFHQFVYPETRARVEGVKKRLSNLGFWVVDFSRTNYDVLFVHPATTLNRRIRAAVLLEKYHLRFRRGLAYWFGS
jgi:FkbM family methyltransferase